MARRRTHEEFVELVKKEVGEEYSVLGRYANNKTKVIMRHEKCGLEWGVAPHNFLLKKTRCPDCLLGFRKTHEKFVEEAYKLTGDEYSVLGKYVNADVKVKMKHNKCGHEYKVRPASFLRGIGCPVCGRERSITKRRWTTAIFREKVRESVGDEYVVIGEYVRSQEKIKMKHSECGSEYEVTPSSFLSGIRCPICAIERVAKKKRWNTEIFVNKVKELVGDEYDVKEEYVGNSTKIRIKHNKCGYEWRIKPNHFMNGRRCPRCSGKEKVTHEMFLERIRSLFGDDYTVLEKMNNTLEKVLVIHNKCGYRWKTQPANFMQGRTCPKCAGKLKLTKEIYEERVKEQTGDEYSVLEDYLHSKHKLLTRHNSCGYEWKVTPNNFLRGNRCPRCKSSKGELAVVEVLESLKIKYRREFKFDDCRNKLPLPFDFAVFNNDRLVCLMEYQGLQHYEPVEYWGGEEALKRTKKNDGIKRVYCEKNNIPLIVIPYTVESIEDFLVDKLNSIINEQLTISI